MADMCRVHAFWDAADILNASLRIVQPDGLNCVVCEGLAH